MVPGHVTISKILLRPLAKNSENPDMVEINNLLNSFSNACYDNSGGVRNYILKIVQIANRLMEVNIPTTGDFVVHRVLDSLSMEYE